MNFPKIKKGIYINEIPKYSKNLEDFNMSGAVVFSLFPLVIYITVVYVGLVSLHFGQKIVNHFRK